MLQSEIKIKKININILHFKLMLFDLRENRRKIQRKNQKIYTTNAKTCGSEKIVNAKFTK